MTRLGDRVYYRLDAEDVEEINGRRDNFQRHQATTSHGKHPHVRGGSGASGHIAHVGLQVHVGERCFADVTQVNPNGRLCLRVATNGSDLQWAVNVPRGRRPGQWQRPGLLTRLRWLLSL
jgi:hypothetical protein